MPGNDSPAAKRARIPQRGPQAPRFIVIEGPLRVGKTTLARILAERLHARRIYDCEDNPFLADFYKAKPGCALRAQMYFLIERQKRLREALAVDAPGPVLSDFLMEKDRIFANLNLDDAELKLYERYYEALTADIPAPDLEIDRKSTRLNSSHLVISYAVFCLKKKNTQHQLRFEFVRIAVDTGVRATFPPEHHDRGRGPVASCRAI